MTEKEIYLKAKEAKSPAELLKIAHDNGMSEFNEENAKAYFDMLNQHGEISEEELENAAGGCIVFRDYSGRKVVTLLNSCSHFYCDACNRGNKIRRNWAPRQKYLEEEELHVCNKSLYDPEGIYGHKRYCDNCYYCSYESGQWICNCRAHQYE